MKIFDRPLAVCCVAFVAMFAAAYFLSNSITALLATVGIYALLSLLLFVFMRKHRYRRIFSTLAMAGVFSVCAVLVSFSYFVLRQDRITEFYNIDVELEGICTSVASASSFNATYTVRSVSMNGDRIREGILLSASDTRLDPGDVFRAKVRLRALSDNQVGFNEREVYEGKGIMAAAELCDGENIDRVGRTVRWERTLYSIRQSARRRFENTLEGRGAALFSAAFVGDRSLIEDRESLDVRRSGTSHLLAVSGMHFSVVMSVVLVFFVALGVPLRLRYILLCVIALAYIGFTGFSAPVIRCGIMLLFAYTGAIVGKNNDSLTSLLCAAVIMLVIGPYNLLSVSYWLSFSATMGIVLLSPAVCKFFTPAHRGMLGDIMRDDRYTIPLRVLMLLRKMLCGAFAVIPAVFVGALVVSVSAIAFSMPFTILFFGNVSHASLLSGIILSPIVSAVLTLSPVVILFGSFDLISAIGSALGEAFFTIASRFSNMDGVYCCVDYSAVKVISVLFISVVLLCILVHRSKIPALILCAAMIPMLLFVGNLCEAEQYECAQSAVSCAGGSDSMAFRSEEGLVVLDMGSTSKTDIRKVLSSSSLLKENEISAYIFTKVCTRQSNVVRCLLTNSQVDTVYLPEYAARNMSILTDAAEEEARALGAEVRYFRFGEEFSVGGYTVRVSELEFLSRSVVPVYSVAVEHEEGSILWLSGAFFEGVKHTYLYGESYDTIVFGSFGPKYKKALEFELENIDCRRYIVGEQSSLEYVASDGKIIGASDGAGYTLAEVALITLDPFCRQKN